MSREPEIGGVVHLKHPSGSSAKIARLGATVLSLQTPRAGEILWLDPEWPRPASSSNNRHGGIPVMFPTFGNMQDERIVGKGDQQDVRRWMKDTPHHGFAKDCVWDLVTTDDGENNCDWPILGNEISHDYLSCVVLRLCPDYVPADLGGSWLRESGDWEILYRISLQEEGLIQDLCVKNKNTQEGVSGDLHAKVLFHNYFRASSPGTVRVYGLNNSDIPIESEAVSSSLSDSVLSLKVPGGVDQVLTLKDKSTMNVVMEDNMHKITTRFDIQENNFPDLVVWAPQVNEQMGHSPGLINLKMSVEGFDRVREETTECTAQNRLSSIILGRYVVPLQTAVDNMFADQKLYQSAQNALSAKIKYIGNAELKHRDDASIEDGVTRYKDLLRRRTSALEETQSIADAAAATYIQSEQIVVNLQAHQAKLNNINKRRFSVEREITKAEMIIDDLEIMIDGTKQQEARILSVADLLSSTLDDLMHVDSAINSVSAIQSWFDEDMPKSVQEEIDATTNNPLYQNNPPPIDDDDKDVGIGMFD